MKKLLMAALLVAGTLSARAAIFINNNTGYDIFFVLWAHDATLPGPCAYYCNRFNVPAGTATAFNNVNSPGLNWSQPWQIPATLQLAGSGWDAVDIVPTAEALGWSTIGNPGSCATSTSYVNSAGGYSINATWTPMGSNVFLNVN